MFLYMPAETRTLPVSVPQFTAALNVGQDDWSFGFDASHLAAAFEVTTEEVRNAKPLAPVRQVGRPVVHPHRLWRLP